MKMKRMEMRDIVSAFPLYVCVLLNRADFFKPSLPIRRQGCHLHFWRCCIYHPADSGHRVGC